MSLLEKNDTDKILKFLRYDLKLEEDASALYAKQASEMDEGWLKRILLSNKAAEDTHIDWLNYAIERVLYSKAYPRVSTGTIMLDDVLFGGIPEGFSIILTSPPLEETELFLGNFIRKGCSRNEGCLFVSTNPKATQIINKIAETPNLYCLVNERLYQLAKEHPSIKKFSDLSDLSGFNITLDDLMGKAEKDRKMLVRARLDILSDIILNHDVSVVIKWLGSLLMKFKSKNIASLWYLDPVIHSQAVVRAILNLFDGNLEVTRKEHEGKERCFIKVKNLYGTKYLEKDVILDKDELAI